MKSAVTNLANQLVQQQKDKLVNQGTKALENLINNNTKKDTTKTQSKKEETKEKVTNAIKDIFGKKK